MRRDDYDAFASTLEAVYTLYGKEMSEAVIAIWWEALRPYDFTAVKAALNRHAVNPDNGQFLPKPADVVKLIEGGTEDAALHAWAKLERGIRSVGPYQSVAFDEPEIHACIDQMGGWPNLCRTEDKELPFARNRFVVLYRGLKVRRTAFPYPNHLPGLTETHNGAIGADADPVCLIGDRDRAIAVLGPEVELISLPRSRAA